MTTKQLEERVKTSICVGGIFTIYIVHRGKEYQCRSNNTGAFDRIRGSDDWRTEREVHYGYTYKQALQALYDECKLRTYR